MTTTVSNYFFVNSSNKGEVVIPEMLGGNFKGNFCLIGNSDDGSIIVSDNVTSISNFVVSTKTDENYTLKDMHNDYIDYVDSLSIGIPIIENWELDNIPLNTHLIGICDGEPFNKKIVSQDGNFFNLDDGSKCFVNWSSMSEITKSRMEISYYHTYFKDIEDFCGFRCKIIL